MTPVVRTVRRTPPPVLNRPVGLHPVNPARETRTRRAEAPAPPFSESMMAQAVAGVVLALFRGGCSRTTPAIGAGGRGVGVPTTGSLAPIPVKGNDELGPGGDDERDGRWVGADSR